MFRMLYLLPSQVCRPLQKNASSHETVYQAQLSNILFAPSQIMAEIYGRYATLCYRVVLRHLPDRRCILCAGPIEVLAVVRPHHAVLEAFDPFGVVARLSRHAIYIYIYIYIYIHVDLM